MSDGTLSIWTIGHSTRTITAFIEMLTAHKIEAVADMRRFPGSRRYPQFDQDALRASLADAYIAYEPFPELGGRRKSRPDSHNTAWRNASFRGYADYMETDAFRAGIARLLELAGRERTAMMCSEAVWWRCHRRIIADYLLVRGIPVAHLMPDGRIEPATLTPGARPQSDGSVTYPGLERKG